MRGIVINPRHTDFPGITVSRIISHMETVCISFLILFSLLFFKQMCVRKNPLAASREK